MNLNVYDKQANQTGSVEVSSSVFEREYSESLIHQVVVSQLANKRQGTKSALTRTEVSGGGKKPWRQKGTGSARQGSTRAPQWIHGGVVFAPKPRDFSQKINKTTNREALKSALSKKVALNEFTVVDNLDVEPKTKVFQAVLKAFGFRKTLVLVDGENDNLYRSARNIPGVTVMDCRMLNVYDLVSHANCLCTVDAVKAIDQRLGEEAINE